MAARTQYPGADEFLPNELDLPELRTAAMTCHGCDLWQPATQTVFGDGPATARLMLVGEQPGDVEDTEGRPFVGPAGKVLASALRDAGLADVPRYTTNAVKHFRFTARGDGKRRIHEKPSAAQSNACRPWLRAELTAVRPTVVLALGATAAASLFGPGFRLTQHRGEVLDWPPANGSFAADATRIDAALATIHPSAVLRADPADRDTYLAGLVDDLRLAATLLR